MSPRIKDIVSSYFRPNCYDTKFLLLIASARPDGAPAEHSSHWNSSLTEMLLKMVVVLHGT